MSESVEEDRAPNGSPLPALAREIRASARADTIFGEPIRQGDVTLVPVARASWGLGGGSRHGRSGGAGGGASVRPVGYIVMDAAGARFCAIETIATPARAAVLGLALGVWLSRRRQR